MDNTQPDINSTIEHKKSTSFLKIILGLLVLLSLSSTAYLAYQNMQLQKQINVLRKNPALTPTPTPLSTKIWKTYTNTKYGFEIKYPQFDPSDPTEKNNSYTDELFEINGLDHTVIRIQPVKTTETDPFKWWSTQKQEAFTLKPASCFETIPSTTIYEGAIDSNEKILEFNSNITKVIELKRIRRGEYGICDEPPFNRILILSHNNKMIRIYFDVPSGLQILSTFKFLDQTGSSYTCPSNGWVDCMPGIGAKPECSSKAMLWYQTNCPDFQGGAY